MVWVRCPVTRSASIAGFVAVYGSSAMDHWAIAWLTTRLAFVQRGGKTRRGSPCKKPGRVRLVDPEPSGDRAPSEVADRGDLKPGSGARFGPLVAARQAPPATDLGDRVLALVTRPER